MAKQIIQVIHFIIFLSSLPLHLQAGNAHSIDLGYEESIDVRTIPIYRVDNRIIGRTNKSSPALLLYISPENTELLDLIKGLNGISIPKNKSEKIKPTPMEEFSFLVRSKPLPEEEIKNSAKLFRAKSLNPKRRSALQRTKRSRNLKLEGSNLPSKKRTKRNKPHRSHKNKRKKRKYR